jgi:3-deoxy-manno-octulosonate cytidylyltransferase (CMP-KDO synthetase)
MRTVAIIPARFASSRFPGKPLVSLCEKPMIMWVVELAASAVGWENTYVATDDERIASVVRSAGAKCIMTSPLCLTGTDRIAEAAEQVEADVYINVQGDEPLLNPSDILKIREEKLKHMDCVINGFSWIGEHEDPNSVNIPKVITTENNKMIYMSRAPLPAFKEMGSAPSRYKKQVCIYGFTRDELISFKSYGQKSQLEASEDIEILRFLELGVSIRMIETTGGTIAVDVPEDVAKAEAALCTLK